MPGPRNIKLATVRKPKANKHRVRAMRPGRVEPGGRNQSIAQLGDFSEAQSRFKKLASPAKLPWPIEMVSLVDLQPAARNSHTHSKKQIQQLVNSIRQFGYVDPILVDEQLKILGGHARAEAAKEAGLQKVPVIIISGLNETKKRALALALNKIPANAGWDRAVLAAELGELAILLPECNLNLEITGFEPAEIDALLGDMVDPEQDPADELPPLAQRAVCKRSDLWELGPHRLLCGDATQAIDLRELMGRDRAAMVFTDPPYNLRINSIVGRGRTKHREFAQASGELSPALFTQYLQTSMSLAAKYSANGSIHFWFMDWRHTNEILLAGAKVYSELKNLIVWVKTKAGQGSFYRSQYELIFLFKNGDARHLNNFELGQHGRSRSNVWTYAGVNTFRAGRMDDLATHPTVKPVALIADAMRDCSSRGDIVLDPFIGSGTTIMAAERVGRRAYGLEIDPLYVDAAVRRWQHFTKRDAVLKSTGQTFDEVSDARASAQISRPK